MPRTLPNPWPRTEPEVRKWRLNNGYDFLLERLELPESLFATNAYSLDGIALTMISLSTLAEYYGRHAERGALRPGQAPPSNVGKDVRRFRGLLDTFAPSFTNRISIPTLAREIRDATNPQMMALAPMLAPMLREFHIAPVPQLRRDLNDPSRATFEAWAAQHNFVLPVMLFNRADYAGLLLANYRHSVVHELSVAKGREAEYIVNELDGAPSLAFYSNQSDAQAKDDYDNIRFGFRPLSILALAKEAIENARAWARRTDTNIFPG
jgi:hypothetical protein